MKLDQLPDDVTVFVDASIFTYYLTGHDALAQACAAFFERTARRKVIALTSAVVAMEVIHRAVVQEAAEKLDLRGRDLIQHLKKHPGVIEELTRHRTVPSIIYRLGVSIEPVTHIHVHSSRRARQNYGLMANDSLIIAFMEKHSIRHLVSNDNDFKRVPNIKVWLPR
jgi:predicted nucleic acid-binding protein